MFGEWTTPRIGLRREVLGADQSFPEAHQCELALVAFSTFGPPSWTSAAPSTELVLRVIEADSLNGYCGNQEH